MGEGGGLPLIDRRVPTTVGEYCTHRYGTQTGVFLLLRRRRRLQ